MQPTDHIRSLVHMGILSPFIKIHFHKSTISLNLLNVYPKEEKRDKFRMTTSINEIKSYRLDQIEYIMKDLQQPKFRAKQLYEWIHTHHASTYEEMTNLPLSLRKQLAEQFPLSKANIFDKQISRDGTRKYVLELSDGEKIETVGLPSGGEKGKERLTVCFSTQAGCAMGCEFCATGKEGFSRNLTASEMIEQVITVGDDFERRVTNIVAMGQGEPFLNYSELTKALRIMNSQDSLKIGARHITVSTSGIIEGIERFSKEPEQYTLAISLHSAIQEKRDEIMPRLSGQPISELKAALEKYVEKTKRRITIEYLLIRDFNDGFDDLKALSRFCEGLLCHVNLLPMNKVEGSRFTPSRVHTANLWVKELEKRRIEVSLRKSRGADISGACGQLKNKIK